MAAATVINVQKPGLGAALTYSNADTSNGNQFSNDGATYLSLFNNGETGEATVTIARSATFKGNALDSLAITLSVGQIKIVGPLDPEVFNIQSGTYQGYTSMAITGTGAADVDIAAFK